MQPSQGPRRAHTSRLTGTDTHKPSQLAHVAGLPTCLSHTPVFTHGLRLPLPSSPAALGTLEFDLLYDQASCTLHCSILRAKVGTPCPLRALALFAPYPERGAFPSSFPFPRPDSCSSPSTHLGSPAPKGPHCREREGGWAGWELTALFPPLLSRASSPWISMAWPTPTSSCTCCLEPAR